MRLILIILAIFIVTYGVCFGANLTSALEEKILSRDRKGAHIELTNIMKQDREAFYKIVESYDPIIGMLETYDKLVKANEKAEHSLIDEFQSYLKRIPLKLPFSQKMLDTINELTADVNKRIEVRNDRIKKASEQREKHLAVEREREKTERQEIIDKIREDDRRNLEEKKLKEQKEREAQIAKLEEGLHSEKVAKAQEAALGDPEYSKQSLICQVCGGREGKRELSAGLKKYQAYERKFGVVNVAARGNAISMDMGYDSQISEGKEQYKQMFKNLSR